jgi:hypothetical protein
MGFAGLVELIGGLLIAFGLLTSYAAFYSEVAKWQWLTLEPMRRREYSRFSTEESGGALLLSVPLHCFTRGRRMES